MSPSRLTRPRLRRSKSLLAAAAAALLALSACSSGGDSGSGTDSNGSGSTGTQAAAGEAISGQTLTWALEKSPVTLNPQQNSQDGFVFVLRNYADSYLYLNDAGEYEPWLAESFTQSDDRLDLTLKLREGVTFSDGEVLNADAVVANFDYLTSDKNPSLPQWNSALDGFEKVDDYTVTFHLNRVEPTFIDALSAVKTSPISPKSLADAKSLEAGGTDVALVGAYTLKSYTEGNEIVLEKNPSYKWDEWGPAELVEANPGAPYADEQIFRILPEASTRTGALTSGQVDVIYGVPAQDVALFDTDQYTYGQVLNSGTVYSLYLNTTKAPFDDIRIRQALQKGVDYDAVVESVYYGNGTVAKQWFSPSSLFSNEDFDSAVKFDEDAANKLLDDAGWTKRDSNGYRTNAEGEKLTIVVNADAPYIRDSRDILFQAIVAEAKDNLGIDFQFQALDPGTVTTSWQDNKNDGFDNSMGSTDISTSLDLLIPAWDPPRIFIGEDPEAVKLIASAKEAPTTEERKKFYDQLQDYVINEKAYLVPLYVTRDNWAADKDIQNILVSEISGHIFSTTTAWRAE